MSLFLEEEGEIKLEFDFEDTAKLVIEEAMDYE